MHILSIEPIELLKANGENILDTDEEEVDGLIMNWFEQFRSSSSNTSDDDNNMVTLNNIL
jgi:hypothetical protein